MSSDLVWLVPTRGRPERAGELVDAWDSTRRGPGRLVLGVDDDDPKLGGYLALEAAGLPDWCEMVVGPRLRLGGTLNALAPRYAVRAGVGFMGDDHRPRSIGWDAVVGEQLAATPGGVVYGNDLLQGAALPTAVMCDAVIVRALGYLVPPGMVHLWLDNYWLELGNRLGTLRYRADVVIEHEHPITGRVQWDDGYREANASHVWEADERLFKQHVASGELAAAVELVHAQIEREAAA